MLKLCLYLLIISLYRERFYVRFVKFSVLYPEYHYIEYRYIRILSHTFYCSFCRDTEYSSFYRKHRYIKIGYIEEGYIGVPLYNLYFATQLQQDRRKEGIDGKETSRKLRLIFTWASTRTVCTLRT